MKLGKVLLLSLLLVGCSTPDEADSIVKHEQPDDNGSTQNPGGSTSPDVDYDETDPIGHYDPTWESLAQHEREPEWFKDAKLGIYFHWGLYSVPAASSEWYCRYMYLQDVGEEWWGEGVYDYHREHYGNDFDYHDFIPMFTAESFDPVDWAKLFKDAGARFAGPVAEHHDGFAMWGSDVNMWNIRDMGAERDITGELFPEIRKQGLRTIATFHHAKTLQRYADKPDEWGGPLSQYPYNPRMVTSTTDPELKYLYGNIPESEFNEYWLNQVNEVVDKYNPDVIWFDSCLDLMPENYRQRMVAHHFNDGVKNEKINVVAYKQNDIPSNVGMLDIEQGGMVDMPDYYWMTDITLSNGAWCYTNGQSYKTLKVLLRNMIDVWSKRGIVLLNLSPRSDGVINNEQRVVLRGLGDWLKKYGEAIYCTRSYSIYGYGDAEIEDGEFGGQSSTVEFTESDIRYTVSKDGKKIYAITLGMPKTGTNLSFEHIEQTVKSVSVLGSDVTVRWEQQGDEIVVRAPAESEMNENATVFVLEV